MFKLYLLIRVLLFPLIRYVLPLFSKTLRDRIEFEQKNLVHLPAIKKAEYGFEVSSEGELEQVKVLINHLLENKKTIELIFCSPSVERQCELILKNYPSQVRLYRYPLLCFNPFSSQFNPLKWISCDVLLLCRYDFFPELIFSGRKKTSFYLLAANLDTYLSKNLLVQKYLMSCYKSFHKIIASTETSKQVLHEHLAIASDCIEVYDFRINQIMKRLNEANVTFKKVFKENIELVNFIKSLKHDKKIIMGSFWNHEVDLFATPLVNQDINVFIYPHKLDQKNILELTKLLEQRDIYTLTISDSLSSLELKESLENSKTIEKMKVWIINYKGVLCESYSLFQSAYVGGGFGESIHSVLEPYVAGNTIACGPKTFRSTEYSYIKYQEPEAIKKFHQMDVILENILDDKYRVQANLKSDFDTKQDELFKFLGI